jgi:hypothetical protein
MRTSLLALAALALCGSSAQAQLIVGNDQAGTATIYSIDVGTGVATALYSSATVEAKPWGMAYDSATNTLYWNNANNLYSSPLANPLVPTLLGVMTFNAANVNFVGLSFSNGKLYGTRNITTEAVYEIDVTTRVATQVWVYPSTFDFGGLEHDATNGKLYGLTDAAAAPSVRGLYEIDPVAQTTTFISGYPGAETDIDGLAVHNGLAYYVSDGPNTTQALFYVYDVASGTQIGTLPSPFTGSGTFSAATFAAPNTPPPTTYCTAGTSTNGCVPSISATGTPSVAASSGFTLDVANVEGQKQGLFFYGLSGQAIAPWGAGSSFICVKSPTQRMGGLVSGGTANACDGAYSQDWLAFVAANPTALGAPYSAGQVVNAQAWYRDPPASKTTNLSNALEFTLAP